MTDQQPDSMHLEQPVCVEQTAELFEEGDLRHLSWLEIDNDDDDISMIEWPNFCT